LRVELGIEGLWGEGGYVIGDIEEVGGGSGWPSARVVTQGDGVPPRPRMVSGRWEGSEGRMSEEENR
jgi:hypothetical protein